MEQGINVTIRAFVVCFWACLVATAAVAGEEYRTEIKIAVDGEAGDHKVFHFDSADSDVDIESMEVGETEVITDKDGNEVTITRTEEGFEINVEGETIDIAGLHDAHEFKMLHDAGDMHVEKHKSVRVIKSHDANGVTIISGDEIDAETRAALEKVLKDAGKDGEVMFIDGSELSGDEQVHGKREVRVIKKEIDVTN